MAKGAYYGVGSVAKKIKKGYVGVGGVAHKIKKGYIGIGGVARPFWGSGELESYGTTTALSNASYYIPSTTVGNYALFYMSSIVDVYNSSLVKSTVSSGEYHRWGAAATVGNYALFCGDEDNIVDVYNSSLVKSTASGLSEVKIQLASTTVGDYALFGGGSNIIYTGDDAIYYSTVDVYNSSLVKSTASDLSEKRDDMSATTVGNYALFGGGSTYPPYYSYADVDAYSSTLVKSIAPDLTRGCDKGAATTVGDYAIFAGGSYEDSSGTENLNDTVDVYNPSLVKSTATRLQDERDRLSATTVGNYALFAGGESKQYGAKVDSYNSSLVHSIAIDLSKKRYYISATTVGDYALFAGGRDNDGNSCDIVDVYESF